MLEAVRDSYPTGKISQDGFTSEEEELADIIIRVLDYAKGFDLDLAGALIAKMAFNESRPIKHNRRF